MFSFQLSDNGIHTLHDSEGRHIANVRSVRGTAEQERELLALIADALRDAGHAVDCIERHSSLRAILTAKGHKLTGHDFTEETPETYPAPLYDAVIMNPPFESGQDCEHVTRAWSFVKPGGALVAIMGAGVQFRTGRPYSVTRDWLESEGAEIVEIPAGTFKESGTGVASVMVTLHKPADNGGAL